MKYDQIHEIININLIEKLISQGSDPNAYDRYGLTPLHYCEDPNVAEYLLRNGANPNLRGKDKYRLTPFEQCHNKKVREVFLKHLAKHIPLD